MTQMILLLQDKTGPGLMGMLPMLLIMFAIIYFLLIRPQQKERKTHQAMLESLKKNDPVVTSGGIYGTVAALEKEGGTVTLKIADNVRIKVTRASIARKIDKQDGASS